MRDNFFVKIAIIVIVALLIVGLTSSKGFHSKKTEEEIYQEAYDEGYIDGKSAGYDEGWDAAYEYAYDEGYNEGYDKCYEEFENMSPGEFEAIYGE